MGSSVILNRILKITILSTIALLFTFFLFNNLTNYHSNLMGVKSVLEMEGIIDTQLIGWRAIPNTIFHTISFIFIIAWQLLTALLCWMGTISMCRNRHENDVKFSNSKKFALIGLTAGFLFFMIGFVIIGSEWFYMWQSMWKNLQLKTLIYAVLLLGCIIFVSNKE